MLHPFKCPKCGYKNYSTKKDIETQLNKFLKPNKENWFGEYIKEVIRNIKNFLPPKPPTDNLK